MLIKNALNKELHLYDVIKEDKEKIITIFFIFNRYGDAGLRVIDTPVGLMFSPFSFHDEKAWEKPKKFESLSDCIKYCENKLTKELKLEMNFNHDEFIDFMLKKGIEKGFLPPNQTKDNYMYKLLQEEMDKKFNS